MNAISGMCPLGSRRHMITLDELEWGFSKWDLMARKDQRVWEGASLGKLKSSTSEGVQVCP
jgi:hypothetical protein